MYRLLLLAIFGHIHSWEHSRDIEFNTKVVEVYRCKTCGACKNNTIA